MNFPYAFIIASNCTLIQTSLYLLLDSRTLRNGEVTAIQVNLVENIRQLKILGSCPVTAIYKVTAIYRVVIIQV